MEFALLVVGGLLGSSHCIGMCGGFALALVRPKQSAIQNLVRQLFYSLGRISTYASLGAMSGWLGQELLGWQLLRQWGGAALAFLAGGVILIQGLLALGIWRRSYSPVAAPACWWPQVLRSILAGHRRMDVFVAGVITGFIPCGLVYAMLALAASSHDLLKGMLVMAAFGAGTIPALALTGMCGIMIPVCWRARVWKLAACCLIATGSIAIARGGYALADAANPSPSCPFCETPAAIESAGP